MRMQVFLASANITDLRVYKLLELILDRSHIGVSLMCNCLYAVWFAPRKKQYTNKLVTPLTLPPQHTLHTLSTHEHAIAWHLSIHF
jgi:hypothetical protein